MRKLMMLVFVATSVLIPVAFTACEVKVGDKPADPPPPPPPSASPTPAPTPTPTTVQRTQMRAIKNVALEGDKVKIPGELEFEFGKSDLKDDKEPNKTILSTLKDYMDQNPNMTKLRVEGHTDNVGKKDENMKLSQARADAVMKWLTAHGIVPGRIKTVGLGDTVPSVPNDTDANRAKNRRTEFHIEEVDGKPFASAGGSPAPSAGAATAPPAASSATPAASTKPK